MQINYNNPADVVELRDEQNGTLSPYTMFKYSVRSELTRKYYERRLRKFLDFIQFEIEFKEMEKRCNDFVEKGKGNTNWVLNQVIRFLHFQRERVEKEEITAATLKNFIKSLKIFCECADIEIPWKKVTRGLPKGRQAANDRAPTIEEIRKLVEYPDRRIKPIVYTMVSSGIRLGAWDFLQWKNVEPIFSKDREIIAAKLCIYAGDTEEYYAFITAEAYNVLKEWMDFRVSYGEKITGSSWIMRDLWQTTNMIYGAHGFRKFYKSRAEQIMRPINVEITMGHDIGISASYYRPTEHEIVADYLKAVDLLTVNVEPLILQKQVNELTEKTQNNEYFIKAKLQEKNDAYITLSDQVMKLMTEVQELKKQSI